MVKTTVISVLIVLTCFQMNGQDSSFEKENLLLASAVYSRSIDSKDQKVYLYTYASYFFDDKFSFEGSTYLGLKRDDTDVDFSIFAGPEYHFIIGKKDPFVKIQPGISLVRENDTESGDKNKLDVNPAISLALGYRQFFNEYFHLFTQIAFVQAMDSGNMDSELRLSLGLGFSLPLKEKQ